MERFKIVKTENIKLLIIYQIHYIHIIDKHALLHITIFHISVRFLEQKKIYINISAIRTKRVLPLRSAISFRFLTVWELGISLRKSTPSSQLLANLGSTGKLPKYGTFNSLHISFAPPVVAGNISDSRYKLNTKANMFTDLIFLALTVQDGQTKTDIFSTTPKIFMLTFRQKSISFRTSNKATSCGVVTITAPVSPALDR